MNASNSGNESALQSNLERLKSVLENVSYDAILNLRYEPLNDTGYVGGVCLSWNESGRGVSGACVDFALNSSGNLHSSYSEFSVNVTSSVDVAGSYSVVNGSLVEVNVDCHVWNEDKPAAMAGFEVYYEYGGLGVWHPTLANVTDSGDGSYRFSFAAQTSGSPNPLQVSLHVRDVRGVSVWANATCMQV